MTAGGWRRRCAADDPTARGGRDLAPAIPAPRAAHRAALRRWARWRTSCILLAPVAGAVGVDLGHRAGRFASFAPHHWGSYGASLVESAVVGGALLAGAARRRGLAAWLLAAVFAAEATVAVGGQRYFFEQYGVYFDADVVSFGVQFRASIVSQILADLGNYLRALAPPCLIAFVLIVLARRWVRLTRRQSRLCTLLAPAVVVAALAIPAQRRDCQASTPDVLFLDALGTLVRSSVGLGAQAEAPPPVARQSLAVPRVTAHPARPRNVLLLLLESVRADATCIDFDPSCRRTEATNLLLPARVGLGQLRALDSSTAISLAVLWSGLPPTASAERLRTQPLLFDYARAAGYHTAYLTSQNLDFGHSRLWVQNLGVERFCSATDLDPSADLDIGAPEPLLMARARAELETLPEPFLLVVHLSNVHYPFLVDPKGPQPFQPASRSKAPADNRRFFNQYLNAVHQQDWHLRTLLAGLARLPAGKRTVVVYTSDHGEAFREHGNMGHTFSVFDEEIHVPGWIDAPTGTLSEAERASLVEKRNTPLTHADLAQTMLDLLGLYDAPELRRHLSVTVGRSMLRPSREERVLPLTNCAGVWPCPFENFGALQGFRKLEAREWDSRWHCYDLRADPGERRDLGATACPELLTFAQETYGRLPGHDPEGTRKPRSPK